MRTVARRIVIGTAAGVVLTFAAGTGVYAYWQAQQSVDLEEVSTGDLAITAEWLGGTPVWTALYPGQSTPDATIRVAASASGDTLAWKVRITETVAAAFEPHTTFQAWLGACGSPNPIAAEGAGLFTAANDRVDVCVRYTLNTGAPESLQGQSLSPFITVHADQVAP